MPTTKRHDTRNALFLIDNAVRTEAKVCALRDGLNFSDWVGKVVKEEVHRRKEQERMALVG